MNPQNVAAQRALGAGINPAQFTTGTNLARPGIPPAQGTAMPALPGNGGNEMMFARNPIQGAPVMQPGGSGMAYGTPGVRTGAGMSMPVNGTAMPAQPVMRPGQMPSVGTPGPANLPQNPGVRNFLMQRAGLAL